MSRQPWNSTQMSKSVRPKKRLHGRSDSCMKFSLEILHHDSCSVNIILSQIRAMSETRSRNDGQSFLVSFHYVGKCLYIYIYIYILYNSVASALTVAMWTSGPIDCTCWYCWNFKVEICQALQKSNYVHMKNLTSNMCMLILYGLILIIQASIAVQT